MKLPFFKHLFSDSQTPAIIQKKTSIHVDIPESGINLERKELQDWLDARHLRYNMKNPLTYALQDVYKDIVIDSHLKAVMEKRILNLVNQTFIIKSDGELNVDKSKLIEQPWFNKLTRYAIESIFYGYSPVLINKMQFGQIEDLSVVSRRHVIPENELIVKRTTDQKGLSFEALKNRFVNISLGENMIGLLEQASPMTILKRHSWGSWDEFEQIFGVPMRIVKGTISDPKQKEEVTDWLDKMGTAPYGIFPDGVEIDVKESKQSDSYNVFKQKIELVNSEISKLILGNTMTTDNGSSKSQGEVHEREGKALFKADRIMYLNFLNHVFIPQLISLGYDLNDKDKIEILRVVDPKERIEIDKELLSAGVMLSKEYLEKTYGVEIDYLNSTSEESRLKASGATHLFS